MAEFPHLFDIFEEYKEREVQLLSVNLINRKGKVESEARRYKLPFPVLIGRDSEIIRDYKVDTLPRLIIIDKTGAVALDEKFAPAEEIRQTIDALLGETEGQTESPSQ